MSSFGYSIFILVAGVAISLASTPQQAPVNHHPVSRQARSQWTRPHYQSNPQLHRSQLPQPQGPASKYVHHQRRIVTFPDNREVYRHNFHFDGNRVHEERAWVNGRGQNEPLVARVLSSSYDPMFDQPSKPSVVYPQQSAQQSAPRNVQRIGRLEVEGESTSPIVLKQHSAPTTTTSWNDNIATLISYIKSNTFSDQENNIGSQALFKKSVVGDNSEDIKLIRSNLENSGLNFTSDDNSCKPKLTTIKIGSIGEPEVIYNPSTVEVFRCPSACFSWQFDCLPTKSIPKNFTVAVYTMDSQAAVTRRVEPVFIENHLACVCSCQSLAGCFGSTRFSPQRLPTR